MEWWSFLWVDCIDCFHHTLFHHFVVIKVLTILRTEKEPPVLPVICNSRCWFVLLLFLFSQRIIRCFRKNITCNPSVFLNFMMLLLFTSLAICQCVSNSCILPIDPFTRTEVICLSKALDLDKNAPHYSPFSKFFSSILYGWLSW